MEDRRWCFAADLLGFVASDECRLHIIEVGRVRTRCRMLRVVERCSLEDEDVLEDRPGSECMEDAL